MLKNQSETLRDDLKRDHEEADTMLVAYASIVAEGGITFRSPSGDIDIVTLFVHHLDNCMTDLYLDNGTGGQRKMLHINSCSFTPEERSSLIGLHAFTGNDYLSSFFRKGKTTCWKKMKKKI